MVNAMIIFKLHKIGALNGLDFYLTVILLLY